MMLKKDYESPMLDFCKLFYTKEDVFMISGPINVDGELHIDGYDFEGKWWD